MTKGGAITGRVLDDVGDPMPLMTVVAERLTRVGGCVSFERATTVETDDLGEYRLFGLAAGELVVATAGGRTATATSPIPISRNSLAPHNYYPHAVTPEQAQPIPIGPAATCRASI